MDLADVDATGPQGRITEEDVRRAATGPAEGRREPLRGVRRLIAEHMTRAHREVPPVTWVEECDFGSVDLKLLVPTVLKATAEALQEFPELNARLEGDEIVYLDRYDLGVAVQTDQGLVVPVVRGVDSRSLEELDAEVRRLAEAARAGTLSAEELRGSTFTVTSAGEARRPVPDADREPPGGRDPQPRPDRRPPGRPGRRDRREAGRLRGAHIRPPCGRRRPGGGVRARRSPPPRGACRDLS